MQLRTFNCVNDARTTSKIIKLSFTREKFEFVYCGIELRFSVSVVIKPQSSEKIELKNIRLLGLNFFIFATSAV